MRPGRGLWRLADPRISLASAGSMLIGASAAARAGEVELGWLAAAALAVFAIEVAKNASGEIVDFDSGADAAVEPADRSPFSGGKRVLIDGILTRAETAWIAALAYAAGISLGLVIALLREPRVLWLGLVGVGCAFFYHAPPVKLSYRGLGELAVGLCYGPLVALGTYLVAGGEAGREVVWLSLPYGLLVACFLWINEFPDFHADRAAGKRTLVVHLGRRRASRAFAVFAGAAFLLLALLPLAGLPRAVWLGAIGAPPAMLAARRLWRHPEETAAIVPAQRLTLLSFVCLAAGAGAGMLLG